MAAVTLTIEVEDEYTDADDPTGLTEEGFMLLASAVQSIGSILDGPERVK